jgi:hypothetical protein
VAFLPTKRKEAREVVAGMDLTSDLVREYMTGYLSCESTLLQEEQDSQGSRSMAEVVK